MKDVKDIVGQTGVEFILPASPADTSNQAIIFSAKTYQYLSQASWYGDSAHKRGFGESVLLEQALVSGPGVNP
jgi:hypothetical protein